MEQVIKQEMEDFARQWCKRNFYWQVLEDLSRENFLEPADRLRVRDVTFSYVDMIFEQTGTIWPLNGSHRTNVENYLTTFGFQIR